MKQKVSYRKRTKLRLFDLLPDELVYIILAHRLSVNYDTFSRCSPKRLLAHRTEVKVFSLVCRRWRRLILPIYYETVIINSKLEADALAVKLRQRHQRIGYYIKKLRIESGQGRAVYTILSKVPRLTTLCISLDDISSKQKAGSLCRGLKLVNPRHFVLRDERTLGNQGSKDVISVIVECMTSTWTNLVLYDHPYDEISWRYRINCNLRYRERHERAKAVSRELLHAYQTRKLSMPQKHLTLLKTPPP